MSKTKQDITRAFLRWLLWIVLISAVLLFSFILAGLKMNEGFR